MATKKVLLIFSLVSTIVLAVLWKQFFPPSHRLLAPTGSHAVGITWAHLSDTSRQDPHATNGQRELLLTIYYPAVVQNACKKHIYMNGLLPFVQRDLTQHCSISAAQLANLNSLKTYSAENAPCAYGIKPYPVVIFSPGFGTPVEAYTMLLENIASHGYVVMGVNYPHITNPVIFPDGHIIAQQDFSHFTQAEIKEYKKQAQHLWIQDIQYIFDTLPSLNTDKTNIFCDRLDLDAIGIMGHSFGAQIVDQVCRIDPRCKAGINIEGKVASETAMQGFATPFLFLMAPHDNNGGDTNIADLFHAIKQYAPAFWITIKGSNHSTCTDFNYLLSPCFKADHGAFEDSILFKWPLRSWTAADAYSTIQFINEHVIAFFDTYLEKKHTFFIQALLDLPVLIAIKKEIHPIINCIIREELGLPSDDTFDFFLPKKHQALTLYYIDSAGEKGIAPLFTVIDGIARNIHPTPSLAVTIAPHVEFFGEYKDELVILVNDKERQLLAYNEAIKKDLHQTYNAYKQEFRTDLYDISQSEKFPFLPHIGLGRIRVTSIRQRIKDSSSINSILDYIQQRIRAAVLSIVTDHKVDRQNITFKKLGVFDRNQRAHVKEYRLTACT